MQKYQNMKDSGVGWLGMVPANWTLQKMSRVADGFSNGTTATQLNSESNYPVTRIQTISKGEIDLSKVGYIKESDARKKFLLSKNDVLFSNINSLPMIGNVAIVDVDGLYHGMNLLRITPTRIDPKFFLYLLRSANYQQYFSSIAKPAINQASIPASSIKSTLIALPSRTEQHHIAEYLEKETAKIDILIAKQERLLGLLEEKRRAAITSAVTKGLKSGVTLRDTGLPWLGKVPTHWKQEKLKYVGDTIIGLTYSPADLADEGTLVLRSMNISNGHINTDTQIFVSKPIPERLLTRENDLLICSRNGSRKLIGKCGLIKKSQEGYTFGVFNTVFRSPYNDYVYYILNSNIFYAQLGLFMTSTINQLTVNTLNNFEIALPPIDEQKEIVSHLKKIEDELDMLVNKVERQIVLLKERRISLISNVVTGKVKI